MFLTGWEKEIVTGANLVVNDLLLPVNQANNILIIPKKIIHCNSVDADLLPVNQAISFHSIPKKLTHAQAFGVHKTSTQC
jgi:hypothetical protein